VGRRYAGRRIEEQLAGLPELGLSPGIVLAPGLPRTRHQDAVDDARAAAAAGARFARVHPVLVLEGSGLEAHARAGTYTPLTLGQAVSTAREVVDVLEAAAVEVVRVGANPLPDGLGRPVAGPFHPSFRQLVDARRVLDRLRGHLASACAGSSVVVRCHPADETITRGPLNQHVRTLRAAFRLAEVRIRPDEALARGELAVDIQLPEVA
jgi:histone acetyltransferase (RNA polymerase elongator complex component)